MSRQPVTVSLEEGLWKDFKKYCIDNNINASDLFEMFMTKRVQIPPANSSTMQKPERGGSGLNLRKGLFKDEKKSDNDDRTS